MADGTPPGRADGGEALPGWRPAPGPWCAKCGVSPVGPGGILCAEFRTAIDARLRHAAGPPEPDAAPGLENMKIRGQRLRGREAGP